MIITPERKDPQGSDASQNDHKSKGHAFNTKEAALAMQNSAAATDLASAATSSYFKCLLHYQDFFDQSLLSPYGYGPQVAK